MRLIASSYIQQVCACISAKAGDSVQSAGLTLICCTARRGGGAEGDKIDMQSLAELSGLATKEIFVLNTEK